MFGLLAGILSPNTTRLQFTHKYLFAESRILSDRPTAGSTSDSESRAIGASVIAPIVVVLFLLVLGTLVVAVLLGMFYRKRLKHEQSRHVGDNGRLSYDKRCGS